WGARAYLLILALALVGGAGCRSTGDSGSQFASVQIQGNTPGQIGDVTVEVFQEHGYKVKREDLVSFCCERHSTSMENFAYGDWVSDERVICRVKARIVAVAERTYRLQCQAYMVQGNGSVVEDEIKISPLRSGQYQKLLDEVGRRLNP